MNRAIQTVVTLMVVWIVGSVIFELAEDDMPAGSQQRSVASYVTAGGRPASLEAFRGDYVWVDYAAEWCSYCEPQTRTIKALEQRYGDKLVFLTVVTGTDQVMRPPDAETARAWADRFGLSHERVLARFSTDTLPHHVLYSPTGEVMFRDSGLYDQDRILSILRAKTPVLNR